MLQHFFFRKLTPKKGISPIFYTHSLVRTFTKLITNKFTNFADLGQEPIQEESLQASSFSGFLFSSFSLWTIYLSRVVPECAFRRCPSVADHIVCFLALFLRTTHFIQNHIALDCAVYVQVPVENLPHDPVRHPSVLYVKITIKCRIANDGQRNNKQKSYENICFVSYFVDFCKLVA